MLWLKSPGRRIQGASRFSGKIRYFHWSMVYVSAYATRPQIYDQCARALLDKVFVDTCTLISRCIVKKNCQNLTNTLTFFRSQGKCPVRTLVAVSTASAGACNIEPTTAWDKVILCHSVSLHDVPLQTSSDYRDHRLPSQPVTD
jgi:hypothetical protein